MLVRSYSVWIVCLIISQFSDVKDDTVYIQIPTGQAHALNYISNKYSNYFKVTISEMMDHDYDVAFILEKEKAADSDTDLKSPASNIYNINYEQANLNPSTNLIPLSWETTTNSPIPPASQSRNLREMPTIRCSSTAVQVWARRTWCTPSATSY